MRLLYNILIGVVVLLILGVAFVAVLTGASGHRMPDGTFESFGLILVALIAALILLIWFKRRISRL